MKKFLLFSLLVGLLNLAKAQDGQLDSSFGNGGIVLTNIGVTDSSNNNNTFGNKILLNPDGSMYLISGRSDVEILNISKKTKDGKPDLSFGRNGYATTLPLAGNSPSVLQPDGKILLVGNILESSSGFYSGVYRINKNGNLDSTFNGKGFRKSYQKYNSFATDIALQKDGKIVVSGYANNNSLPRFFLYRINPDGSDDSLFTQVGKFTDSVEIYSSIAVQKDGKIVAGGYKRDALYNDIFTLTRHNSDGSIDTSFKPTTGIPPGEFVFIRSIKTLIDGDGNILVAGTIRDNFGIARFKKDGSFDTLVTTNFKRYINPNYVYSASIGSDGKITLIGLAEENFAAIASFNKDLSLNTEFSDDGILLAASEGFLSTAKSVTIQNDGKILLSGYINSKTNNFNIAAVRFNSDGSIDESFADKGKLHEIILQGNTVLYAVAVQNDGKVVAGGQAFNGSNLDFGLVRYTKNGSLDNSFSGDGKVMTDGGNQSSRNIIQSLAIQADGKIIAGGDGSESTALVRYNTNGSIDHDYGPVVDFDINNSIAIQKDGRFVVSERSGLKRYKNFDLDSSFNGIGHVSFPENFISNAIALQKNDKIVVLGISGEQQSFSVILRYDTNGKLDSTFGTNGKVINRSDHDREISTAICIQSDDKILIGGSYLDYSNYGISTSSILRLNKNGSRDSTFNGGKILYPFSDGTDETDAIKVQSDGKIIIAGNTVSDGISYFKISRFNQDGSIDKTFNNTGSVLTYPGGAYARISSIAIQGNNLYAVGFAIFPGRTGVIAKYRLCNAPEILPLKINFEGKLQNNKTALKWQVQNQHQLKYFTIEKSRDAINFNPIENIVANNSTITSAYSTIDNNPFAGANFYRLKLKNADSSFTYSSLVNVNLSSINLSVKISPNPATNRLIVIASGENEKATIKIFDIYGRKHKAFEVSLNSSTPISIDINALPSGIYSLQLIKKSTTEIIPFVKQ